REPFRHLSKRLPTPSPRYDLFISPGRTYLGGLRPGFFVKSWPLARPNGNPHPAQGGRSRKARKKSTAANLAGPDPCRVVLQVTSPSGSQGSKPWSCPSPNGATVNSQGCEPLAPCHLPSPSPNGASVRGVAATGAFLCRPVGTSVVSASPC